MKMNGVSLALLLLLSLNVLAQPAVQPKEFTVTGKIKNYGAGEKVYLQLSNNPPTTIDSTTLAADGSFTIKSIEKEGGNFYILNVAERQRIILLIEGGETLSVTADGFEQNGEGKPGLAEVTGSENMRYYTQLVALNNSMITRVNAWNEQYAKANEKKDTKTMQAIQEAFQQAEAEHIGTIKKLLPEMGTSLVAIFAANNLLNPERDMAEIETVAKRFEKENPNPRIAQAFIGYVKRIRGVAVGDEAPDFTLNDPDGKNVSLSSLRGQYVLIDFWASWCGPCRMENPNVVRMYNKYKDKGFAIYGVSLDDNKNAWVTAIEKDKLTWTHGSELLKWNSPTAQAYGVNGIPATFLLDKEGKVIGKNLRGAVLEKKLEELFGK